MAKKFVIRKFKPGNPDHNHINPLLNLSMLGITKNVDIMKTSLALSKSETNGDGVEESFPNFYAATGTEYLFQKYKDLTSNQASNYAYYDQSYTMRKQACMEMARDNEIAFLLNTITNEALVKDDNGYIAHLDLDKLKLFLNKGYNNKEANTNADNLIRDIKIAYQTVYSNLGWDDNDGAQQLLTNFLQTGYIALEILIHHETKTVIGFLELAPETLEPAVEELEDGSKIQVWYQFRGDAQKERKIPDSNLIYIAWNGNSSLRSHNISYVESLTRSFHMLRSLENSQLIFNIMNAQKRMKLTIPMGLLPKAKADERLQEIIAEYAEEVSIDDASGQMLVNGEPKFNFQKTFVFEEREGATVGMECIDTQGYDLSTTALQYFYRKFILESQVPANRFTMDVTSGGPTNNFIGDANVTREEYAFSRFIQRIQGMFKEVLLKPLWIQICLKHPELSRTDYLKGGLGIKFHEENLFTLAKKRTLMNEGAQTVSTLMGIQVSEGNPYFSIDFLIKEFLGMTDQQLEINRKYKEAEILRNIEVAKLQKKHAEEKLAETPQADGGSADADFGGGFGGSAGGDVMGGGEFGGPSEGGDDAGGF